MKKIKNMSKEKEMRVLRENMTVNEYNDFYSE